MIAECLSDALHCSKNAHAHLLLLQPKTRDYRHFAYKVGLALLQVLALCLTVIGCLAILPVSLPAESGFCR